MKNRRKGTKKAQNAKLNAPKPKVHRMMNWLNMQAGQAAGFRAQGSQRSLEIRAKADREVTVLIAQATAASEQVHGDGDAAPNRIYAAAYERDPEFFAFYRTMQAYENVLPASKTRMLLTPDSDFFRYFGDPMGKICRPKEPR
jgi:membrane protease subunit HflC